PRARDVIASMTSADVSDAGFPFSTCRKIDLGTVQVLASRISYVGELGWELHCPIEQGAKLWSDVWDAGQPCGVVPVGIGVYVTTARLEKCYRAIGAELEFEYNVIEAGLERKLVKKQDFIGKQAYLQQREEKPAAQLCTLTMDSQRSKDGSDRFPLGHEPI